MTHSLTKPGGWAFSTELKATEITDIDEKTRDSLDKTSAGDTLSGVVTLAATGQIVSDTAGSKITVSNDGYFEVIDGAVANVDSASTMYVDGAAIITGVARTLTGGRIQLADNDYPEL